MGRFSLGWQTDDKGWYCDVPIPEGVSAHDVVVEKTAEFVQVVTVRRGQRAEDATEYRTRLRWPDESGSLHLETVQDGAVLHLRIKRPGWVTKVAEKLRSVWTRE